MKRVKQEAYLLVDILYPTYSSETSPNPTSDSRDINSLCFSPPLPVTHMGSKLFILSPEEALPLTRIAHLEPSSMIWFVASNKSSR
eukprot:13586075-Ditylum_brightwellii.AAC.1